MTLKITPTKAPVGPPTWGRGPPKADMRKPAITAVTSPLSGDAPLAIASAMDKGSATTATVRPASASARRLSSLYPSRRTVTSFGVSDFVLIVDQLRRFHATVRRGRPPCLAHAPRSARCPLSQRLRSPRSDEHTSEL